MPYAAARSSSSASGMARAMSWATAASPARSGSIPCASAIHSACSRVRQSVSLLTLRQSLDYRVEGGVAAGNGGHDENLRGEAES